MQAQLKQDEIKGNPMVIILIYPEHRDLDNKTEPIYVSTATGAGEGELTIE